MAVVKHLKSMGLDVWLITGDNLRTASAIARQMGIDHVKAVALPGEKAAQIKALQSQVNPRTKKCRVVCMVGDGINDAPALAQSDIGMAIGAGTQIAKAEADMVLVKSTLVDVVVALDLARVVFFRIRLNFFFSIVYNFIGIPLAAGMFFPLLHRMMPPACAGLAMAFSSVSVVVSSLLLKKYKAPQIGDMKQRMHFEEETKVVDLKNLVRLKLNTSRQMYAPVIPKYGPIGFQEARAQQHSGLLAEQLVDFPICRSVEAGGMVAASSVRTERIPSTMLLPADGLVVELAVEGMMCMKNCGATVQSALRSVDGVASAVVDFEKRS
ncbi:hypothetical protein BBJ28_00026753, partial [Nothophytophthora sp. Chile5]